MDTPVRMTNPGTAFASEAAARQHPLPRDCWLPDKRWSGCTGRRLDAGQPALMLDMQVIARLQDRDA
jgi:hypothetical protein